jgi:hypothetical protein
MMPADNETPMARPITRVAIANSMANHVVESTGSQVPVPPNRPIRNPAMIRVLIENAKSPIPLRKSMDKAARPGIHSAWFLTTDRMNVPSY